MKLDSKPSSCVMTAAVLALALSGCGQEPPPKPAVKVVPVPAPEVIAAPVQKPVEDTQAVDDKALAARVKSALIAERALNAHGIDVVAKNGTVTLYGTAETRVRRDMAEHIAARVDGVKSVENKLAVVAGS
jgi:BON domain